MNAALSSLLVQQERNNLDRTYLSGQFGQLSYRETLTLIRQLTQFLASSDRINMKRSIGISTASPQYIAIAVWAAIFADISIVFLPLCRDPEVMRRAMEESSADMLLTDEPVLLQELWCQGLKEALRSNYPGDSRPGVSEKGLPTSSRESDAGFIFQTSGTAGEPKWVQCEYRKFSTVID